jgi:glycosyltransferase involved in cell wall biosynthesis
MIEVRRPTAVIYGWKESGLYTYITDLYSDPENIRGWVDIHSVTGKTDLIQDYLKFKPDVIIAVGFEIKTPYRFLQEKIFTYDESPSDQDLANFILKKTVEFECSPYEPTFSIFTPAFKSGERINRTYKSLADQTYFDWEWIVVDDSPAGDVSTWTVLQGIAARDFRVKPVKVHPVSGGNVGLVKHRAAMLSSGRWLVELDHDDYLMKNCLEECLRASEKFPDAGFIYSDCTEMSEDGKEFRDYDYSRNGDYYGRPDNWFAFSYAGHTWKSIGGKEYLQHHYPDINPITIRFNTSMPNHVRVWRKDVYRKIGGHRQDLPVADDFELIIRTFLETRFIHIKKILYIQHFKLGSTVDLNSFDINRRARLVRDFYDQKIHSRIGELGFFDWDWNPEKGRSLHESNWSRADKKDLRFGEEEQIMNYIYE